MALATNVAPGDIHLNGDFIGSLDAYNPELTSSGVISGVYFGPEVVVDAKGRVLSASTMTVESIPDATIATKGICSVGSGLSVASGVLSLDDIYIGANVSVPNATLSSKGHIQIGTGISVTSGLISADMSTIGSDLSVIDATTSSKGQVQIGSGVSVVGGVLSIDTAYVDSNLTKAEANTTFGIVKSNNTTNIAITSGLIDVGALVAKLDAANTWTDTQIEELTITPFVSNITIDFSTDPISSIALTGNTTLATPLNPIAGGVYYIIISQDATGGRTVTFPVIFNFGTGDSIVSTAANSKDVICLMFTGSEYLTTITKDFS